VLIFENDIMKSPAVSRHAPAMQPLVLATAISLCLSAAPVRADDQALPTVTVSGSRFASDPAFAPIGATVISAADIRRAGVSDANEAIRKIGGVYGRQSLDGSPDFGLDLRGFGSNSSQNVVVVVDGVRLSENELSGAILSTIPVDTIERIEIMRGGASVLYGDGATGGVINIVTQRAGKNSERGSASVALGQFGLRELRASGVKSWDNFAFDLAASDIKTDNYRDHNEFKNRNFSGGLQWSDGGLRAGLRMETARQDAQFPGSLTEAGFLANPRTSNTPLDFGALASDRVSAFVEQRIGAFDLAAELSHREKTADASYTSSFGGVSYTSALSYEVRQNQFSPRLRHLAPLNGMLNELVAGVDLIRWNRKTDSAFSLADATQKSKAFYLRDELKWDAAHNGRLSAGVRRESFDKTTVDSVAMLKESSKQSRTAWEVQGSVDVMARVNLFAKAGSSYRVPNSDENGYRPTQAVLKIQGSRDLEIGAVLGDAQQQLTARLFRHALTNEIFYDPTLNGYGANTNLDPTRRQGVEIDAHARVAPDWKISAHLQHVKATFRSGPNAGREMVLVPENVLSARLSWLPADGQSFDAGVQWVDSQRFGGDFLNNCSARIASYTTIDARYARRFGPWELALSGVNLADKQYYSQAFQCKGGIYPSDGRQLKFSARYDF
jgi:iron complex outermembrane receptor protein